MWRVEVNVNNNLRIMKRTRKSRKLDVFVIIFSFLVIGGAVYLTSSNTGGSAPTGFERIEELTVEETMNRANLDIPELKELPFTPSKEEGTLLITKFGGNKEHHRVELHFINEETSEELYYIASQKEQDLLEYEQLQVEEMELANKRMGKYAELDIGEGIEWLENGAVYGLYHHTLKGQEPLGADVMVEMANSIK